MTGGVRKDAFAEMREHGDLIAFLSARLDEDEAAAKAAASVAGPDWRFDLADSYLKSPPGSFLADTMNAPYGDEAIGPFLARHSPGRVLRDVKAGRAIIERYQHAVAAPPPNANFTAGQDDGYRQACADAIRDLAAAWSDHPDYRQEWRP